MTNTIDTAQAEATAKLWSMIRDIRVAMLTSIDGEHLHSRPMAASQAAFDGTLWFFTRADSHKTEEVAQDDRVAVTYASPESQTYVALSGRARLVRDAETIAAHWSELLRTWFPLGRQDPEIALLRVDVDSAEYWDAPSSRMLHLYGYAKAVLTGRPPHPGENQKLTFA